MRFRESHEVHRIRSRAYFDRVSAWKRERNRHIKVWTGVAVVMFSAQIWALWIAEQYLLGFFIGMFAWMWMIRCIGKMTAIQDLEPKR